VNATIRRAVLGDERTLAELNAFVHDVHVISNPAYFKPSVREEVIAWFLGLLEKSTVRIWVAEVDGVPVGYASTFLHERAETAFCHSRRWLEVDQLGVRPDWRRRGIARALVQVVLGMAKDEGIREVELSSWVFNNAAHDAFRRLGFTPRVVRFGWPSLEQ
jgi:GNAT superfamily N-acetyltransferase